ncbi:MAG: UvrD-helicase domain-containing protein [Rhodocyclaceae bacterium]|nr:UvrD-helicase domain-containing protein [Rhodocyclaceae bacterium]
MSHFHRAREAANNLRREILGDAYSSATRSSVLIEAIAHEDAKDFTIETIHPADKLLGGADALLVRQFRQVFVRNDVSSGERAFLIAHEFGHWVLHPQEHDSCHKVIGSNFQPESGETFGAQKVEAYGARERSELQANIFGRELLLPRSVAKSLFLAGRTAEQLQVELDLPLELVRQQLLDGLLLPEPTEIVSAPKVPITPTAEQVLAATSKAKVSLVVAGPGTGKTETLLMRVQHLISIGVKPSEMLLLTFSNRAAREMVGRLQMLGVEGVHDIWVGTFHAFGLEFLRKNHERFGLRPQFGVADKMGQIAVLEPHIYGLNLKEFSPLGDPLEWLNKAVQAIQRAKDELAGPDAYAKAVEDSALDTDASVVEQQRDIAKLYQCYESNLRKRDSLVDMGDLIMLPAIALTQNYKKFEASVGRFKHILVDEYQDVNRASAQLVKALENHAESLWVVGDARQAIYRFRGASMRNIVRFGDDFPKHKTFPLNENRRSYEEIIRVFEHTGRDANPLQMVLPLDDVRPVRGACGIKPRHIECGSDKVVHGELVENIGRLHSSGLAYRDQVVLANTHSTCGDAASALNAAGIPALYLGDIFQRLEIKDLLAILQLFVDRSGSGLLRVSKLPGLEIPVEDVNSLLVWCKANRPDALSWLTSPPPVSPAGQLAIQHWANVFDGLTSASSPWEVACTLLLDRTSILRPYLEGDGILDITRRLALWQFIYYLRVPDGGSVYQTVGGFLTRLRRRLRIGDDRELRIPPPEADAIDAVAVMTIHGSKGLEFEAVHLVDIDARHFSASVDTELVPRSLLKAVASPSASSNFEEQTEALNKLYVALSRARKHLVLYESKEGYNAACVGAISQAAHLFETVQGAKIARVAPQFKKAEQPALPPQHYDLSGFLTYRVCARRYYYDFVKELSPSAGLHPALLIEGAVMRDLFVAYGEDPNTSSNEAASVLASLDRGFKEALPHLKAYADQLLENGRTWLNSPRAAMAKPFDLNCAGLPLHIRPHRVTNTNSVVTIEFVRARPGGKKTNRQLQTVRWILALLSEKYSQYTFRGSIFVLSTGVAESLTPYSRAFVSGGEFFLNPIAKRLADGNFEARPTPWECPKCRHLMYCPA